MRFGPLLCLLVPFVISGCEGSLARNALHPDRQFFDHGDYQIVVLKQTTGWSAWYQGDSWIGWVPNLAELEPVQVKAIEQASGCKVTNTYRIMNNQPAYLEAAVDCTQKPTAQ